MSKYVKLVFFVPATHADVVRQAMGDVGAGLIGNYSHCTFSSRGFARFTPLDGSNPAIGIVGAIVGGYLGQMFFGVGVTGFNIPSVVVAVIGALLVMFASRMLMK